MSTNTNMSESLIEQNKTMCPICKKVFERKSEISHHLKSVHPNCKRKLYKCSICNISFLRPSSLNIHRHLHNANKKQTEVSRKKISEMYKNVVSETVYSSDSDCEYELLQTVIKVNSYRNSSYTCNHCDKKFINSNNLKRHAFNKHGIEPIDTEIQLNGIEEMEMVNNKAEETMQIEDSDVQEIITIKTVTCDDEKLNTCDKLLQNQSVLKNGHNNLYMPSSKKYRCSLCGRSYSQKIYYDNHMRLHKDGKTNEIFDDTLGNKYSCVYCGKMFGSSSHLSAHQRLHIEGKRYLCRFCGKSFSLPRYLMNHERTHTQERPFQCELCNKRFIHKGNLAEHVRIHSGLKPHECTICDKKFTQYSGLTQHLQTHIDHKKYNCEVCGKSFRFSGHFKGHMRTHTGDKPFACTICDKRFALSNSLTIHRRTHTGDRPFKCESCNKRFIKSSNLKQHLKSYHSCKRRIDKEENTNAIDVETECISQK